MKRVPSDQHDREKRKIAGDPPGRRLIEEEAGEHYTERRRIEQVLPPDRQDVFR